MDQVSQIRERTDLVALLSEYITLKKAGRNFKARCPFHEEKSPSFVASPDRQIWHCFGCGKGGDAYTFLMEYERIEFPEALRLLAKRAGITLQSSNFDSKVSEKKEKLAEINSLTAEFYHYILTTHPAGEKAREYLKNRGVSEKVMESFKIGYAPVSSSSLSEYLLKKKKLNKEDLLEAGLGYERGGSVRDFFYGRLMFPLIDSHNTVVGFSGRILDSEQTGPKYINTRETMLYHKGEHLFGIHLTKDSIRKENQAILVEGEFDVMSCFQNGVGNVVAVKGTALTERQVTLLSRFATKITMCFDGDTAGQEAIKRSLPIIEKKGLTTSVIVIPSGKDPDESLQTNPIEFLQAAKQDMPVYDFLLNVMSKRHNPETIEGKKEIGKELLPIISQIQNEIVKEHYIRKLAEVLQTSYESVLKEMQKQKEIPLVSPNPITTEKKSQEEKLEDYLLALVIQSPQVVDYTELLSSCFEDILPEERSTQKVLSSFISFITEGQTVEKFSSTLPTELLSSFDTASLFPLSLVKDQEKKEINRVSNQLSTIYVKKKIKELSTLLSEEEDIKKREILQQRYDGMVKRLQSLTP